MTDERDPDDYILYEKDPATKIATLTLNRPERMNAPTIAMRLRYAELLHQANIDDDVLQCASVCGASGPRVFRTVVIPLSMPGVVAGDIVAFSLTAAGFVIPGLVGGAAGSRFAAVLMYQQITATQNWRFGAAIGVLLLAVSVLAVAGGMRIARRLRTGRVLSDTFIQ